MIFRLYLHGEEKSGLIGIKEIVKYLNGKDYRTKRNARFGVGTLHKILTSTIYAGECVFNRNQSKTGRQKPASEHITVDVPAIINRAEFDAVQATLKSRNPRVMPPRIVSGPILLTGLAVCASCNGSMTLSRLRERERIPAERRAALVKFLHIAGDRHGWAGIPGHPLVNDAPILRRQVAYFCVAHWPDFTPPLTAIADSFGLEMYLRKLDTRKNPGRLCSVVIH